MIILKFFYEQKRTHTHTRTETHAVLDILVLLVELIVSRTNTKKRSPTKQTMIIEYLMKKQSTNHDNVCKTG